MSEFFPRLYKSSSRLQCFASIKNDIYNFCGIYFWNFSYLSPLLLLLFLRLFSSFSQNSNHFLKFNFETQNFLVCCLFFSHFTFFHSTSLFYQFFSRHFKFIEIIDFIGFCNSIFFIKMFFWRKVFYICIIFK